MKFHASILACIFASIAVARPRAADEGEPLKQWSRVTAFVLDEEGKPSVECWEVAHIVENMQIKRKDGPVSRGSVMSLAKGRELDGVDVITWPAYSPLYPPSSSNGVRAAGFDFANTFNLFNIQGGLINFNFYAARFGAANYDDDESEQHVFSLENGDDWFYFEDTYTDTDLARSSRAPENPFEISTISGSVTEALRLRFNSRPTHKVVHKGACHFTGIHTEPASSSRRPGTSRFHSPLTVQVSIQDEI